MVFFSDIANRCNHLTVSVLETAKSQSGILTKLHANAVERYEIKNQLTYPAELDVNFASIAQQACQGTRLGD